MQKKLFGTDGIRGVANKFLTPELAFNLGRSFAVHINKLGTIALGRDTRISGSMLCAALSAGISSMGINVIDFGVLPTPALCYLTQSLNIDGGIMITASHNPACDNGLKFYNTNGTKVDIKDQEHIENILREIDSYIGEPNAIGRIDNDYDSVNVWVEHIINSLSIPKLNGLTVALDCANGASYEIAPYIFKLLGAKVLEFNCDNKGQSINKDCGSLYVEKFAEKCAELKVDFGFSFDGDADRVMAVNNKGEVLDGTAMMYVFANYLKEKEKLNKNAIVTTSITNCGLENCLEKKGIKTIRTDVGGLHIQREMLKNGYNVGGEENGHLIIADNSYESDGIATALLMCKIYKEEPKFYDDLKNLFRTQTVKTDLRVSERVKAEVAEGKLDDFVNELENFMGSNGRIIVRTSGTECLVRVLVEGDNEEILTRINDEIVKKIGEL